MNYELAKIESSIDFEENKIGSISALVTGEVLNLMITLGVILINSALTVAAPLFLGEVIDDITQSPSYSDITKSSLILLAIYIFIAITSYFQTILAGNMGQRILYRLRHEIFAKLQSLPIAFFNANKSGDLISRINNDTNKLNQFFSEGLVRFTGEVFILAGIGIFIFFLNWKLALVTLSSAVVLFVFTRLITPWLRSKNRKSLEATGNFAADIQENLNNYKVLVVFNRKDYFRDKMKESTKKTYEAAVKAGIANNISTPLYDLASKISFLMVLVFGLSLVANGEITLGLLITFIAYANSFYTPLRESASVYSMVQTGLAAWGRIQEILSLQSNMETIKSPDVSNGTTILEFKNVDFGYASDKLILNDVSFKFDHGKIYALVGPTGGGKSTTASLMARLYDPVEGKVFLNGKDIRSFTDEERTDAIGFILQDPYIFTGTVYENIVYGNKKYENIPKETFIEHLQSRELHDLIDRFPGGLDTEISSTNENISLGQKQLVAFIRTLLREPKLLILDEATANIDTITEKALQTVIDHMPKSTTKVIIAHRLNTIEKADEIIFVNGGTMQKAQSFDETVKLIQKSKRNS
jgi:ATP-binding cassette, subfamily B, bacterial